MTGSTGKSPSSSGRRRLGRGLESLITAPVQVEVGSGESSSPAAGRLAGQDRVEKQRWMSEGHGGPQVRMLPIETIRPNPHQPRRNFDADSLARLARSIESDGLMQPVVVRSDGSGGHELIAGERRWRAARMIDLAAIPAIMTEVDDETATQWSLIENIQREDLNPIERGEAFERLITEYGATHEEIAERVGLDRTSVTNHVRLLELDGQTKEAVRAGELGMGHGRALLAITILDERRRLVRQAIRQGWSVRDLEGRIRRRRRVEPGQSAAPPKKRAQLIDLERRLGEHLGTQVRIQPGRKKGSGKLVISFYSIDEFEGLMGRLAFRSEEG